MADNVSISIEGLDECLRAFQGLQTELRRNANGELRRASAAIGRDVIVPMLGGSGAPQEAPILAAAGPKSDRYIVVAVPNRKPRLSGLKKTSAAQAKRIGFALEGGSSYPPFHGPGEGSVVASHRSAMAARAVPKYQAALASIMRKYGLL